ncbi:Protein of unknown function (DUF3060) [Mumia flava]|uniref:DUF3060 family protein n=1 Tax=Mumia flava TaxID=1348852 RepID=A0A2M9B7M3_9ACTN|nr:DUF3060 domain-containing protein [Mumia flava]PJJ53960.1 Protein of unknown function (DUF3060) [Mumia flava]
MVGRRTAGLGAAAVMVLAVLAGCAEADDVTEDAAPSPASAVPTDAGTATDDGDPGEPGDEITIGPDQEHDVTSSEAARVHCDGGGEIDVRAATSVAITGSCEDVDVSATGATVSIEATDDLSVEGDENEVNVDQVREIDVEGARNDVSFGGSPQVDVTGPDNHVAGS